MLVKILIKSSLDEIIAEIKHIQNQKFLMFSPTFFNISTFLTKLPTFNIFQHFPIFFQQFSNIFNILQYFQHFYTLKYFQHLIIN